jgi:FKBP-type peptidyl-prolyl cis-trans isomerase
MKKLLVITSLLLTFSAYSQSQFRLTVSGLEFNIIEKNEGKTAKIGDFVTLDILIVAENGYEVKNSYKEGKPILFPIKYRHHDADIYEAISLMAEGDSAVFYLSADSTFEKVFRKPMPEQIKEGTKLTLYAKVYKIRSQKEYRAEQQVSYNSKYAGNLEELKKEDETKIKAYLNTLPEKAEYEEIEEVYLRVTKTGQGKMPVKGQSAMFHYTIYLLNGQKVESSYDINKHPVSFTLGENNVIKGWEIAFSKVTEGSEFELIVPSHLAYGPLEKKDIPKNANLKFKIKFIKVQ